MPISSSYEEQIESVTEYRGYSHIFTLKQSYLSSSLVKSIFFFVFFIIGMAVHNAIVM